MPCKSKTFCMHPFTGLATREDGAIKICCRSAPIGDIKDNTLEEIWNGDKMKEVLFAKAAERIDIARPYVANAMFGQEFEYPEGEVETEVGDEPTDEVVDEIETETEEESEE